MEIDSEQVMDADTQSMLRRSLRPVLAEEHAKENARPLTEQLAELGWDDVLAADAPTALTILFETRGETLSGADALGPLLVSAIASHADLDGGEVTTVLLPASLDPGTTSSRIDGDDVVVDAMALARPGPGSRFVVPVQHKTKTRLVIGRGDLDSAPVEGIDPDLGLVRMAGRLDANDLRWVDDTVAEEAWQAAVAIGRWTSAAELGAIGARVVDEAVAYTKERHQYGRPIGSFQALQHRLASAHASVVGARQVVAEAARSGRGWDAMVAKYLAGRAAEDACTQAQQSYGAIGFTWEHDFHRSLRRVYVLDRLLGGWRELEHEIGATLQRTGVVPKIGSL